jgi:PAS domain S-box-containing protein
MKQDSLSRQVEAARQRLETLEQREELAATRQDVEAERQRYQALFEFAPDGYLVTDAQGIIEEANRAAAGLLRVGQDYLVGKPLLVFVAEAEHEAFETGLARLQRGEADRLQGWEIKLQPHSGAPFPAVVTVGRVREAGGRPAGLCWALRGITERARSEDVILLSQVSQALTATLDPAQVAEGVLGAVVEIIGTEGCSIWLWDEAKAGELVCWAAAKPTPKQPLVNLRVGRGEGIVGWVAQSGKSVISSRVSDDTRFAPTIDNETGFRTVSVLAVPLRIRDVVIGVLETVNKLYGDFDAHDCAMLEALALPAAIAIENARLVEALRQQTGELRARNEELDAFAFTAAHDLKNPLSLIISYASVLNDDYATLSGDELREVFGALMRTAFRMSSIIDELLLLAGVRKTQVAVTPLDMPAVVAAAWQCLTGLAEQYQAEIIMPSTWPVAQGYGPWLVEVWANYLSNAIKYGGRPPRVELGATFESEAMVRFWVRDNGSGLTAEDQAQLFIPFTRLGQMRATGHGLGLSIVRRIVEKLGGQVGVESEVGQGSVFFFTLPRVAG